MIPPRCSSQIHAQTPHIISQEEINNLTMLSQNFAPQFTPRKLQQPLHFTFDPTCNAVVRPVTGKTITKYKKLVVDEVTKPVWEEAMCKELGRLAQGYNTTKGTNTIHFMKGEDIKSIPTDQTVTYPRIVVGYSPQKKQSK